MPKHPTLYEYTVCPFCWKIKAILNFKKIPFERIEVNPINKKEIAFSPDYRKVPIFIDANGKQINDSTPIMRYIDEHYPQQKVFEKDASAKEIEDEWIKWSEETFVRALPPLIYSSIGKSIKAFDYITKSGKFNFFQRYMIKYSGAFIMHLVGKKSAKRQEISDTLSHFQNCLDKLNNTLSRQSYLKGQDSPNGADLAIWGILASIKELPDFKWVKEKPAVYSWFKRIESLQ